MLSLLSERLHLLGITVFHHVHIGFWLLICDQTLLNERHFVVFGLHLLLLLLLVSLLEVIECKLRLLLVLVFEEILVAEFLLNNLIRVLQCL